MFYKNDWRRSGPAQAARSAMQARPLAVVGVPLFRAQNRVSDPGFLGRKVDCETAPFGTLPRMPDCKPIWIDGPDARHARAKFRFRLMRREPKRMQAGMHVEKVGPHCQIVQVVEVTEDVKADQHLRMLGTQRGNLLPYTSLQSGAVLPPHRELQVVAIAFAP